MKYIKIIFVLALTALLLNNCSLPEPSDATPPVGAIIYPYANAVIHDVVKVLVEATDNDKIDEIRLYLDDEFLETKQGKSVEFEVDVTPYADDLIHVFTAVIVDKSGNQGYTAQVPVLISDSPDLTPPVVSIVNPQSGQQVQDTVLVVASAQDDFSVREVAFFVNGDSVSTDDTYPYQYIWYTSELADSTNHTIFAKAFDNSDNWSLSSLVTVTVFPRIDREPPVVVLIYPTPGSVVSGTITVAVDATDNGGIDRIEFFVDGFLVDTDTEESWSFIWDTTGDPGAHSLYFKAYDNQGNVGTYGPVTVTSN